MDSHSFQKLQTLTCTTHIEAVKEVILPCLVFHEQLNILVDPLLHWDGVEVTDGIFTQEIKLHDIIFPIFLRVKCYVLNSQRTAANSIGSFISILLITSPQRKLKGKQVTSFLNESILSKSSQNTTMHWQQ